MVRQLRILGAEMECSWTLARLELLEGSDEAALEHCRDVLRRWEETEDLHYSLNALGWSAGLFAAYGQEEDLDSGRARARNIAAENGNREALAMLAGALGEPARGRAGRGGRRALPAGDRPPPGDRAPARPRGAPRQRRGRRARGGPRRAGPRVARPTRACTHAARRKAAPGDGRARARRARRGRGNSGAAGGLTPRQLQVIRRVRRGADKSRDRGRALPLGAHGRHARPPLADRARCRSRVDAARKAAGLGLLEQGHNTRT